MARIFVSYNAKDRDRALLIGEELIALGHVPYIHEREIGPGDDIYGWMQKRLDAADHMLCVISGTYLEAAYSTLERNAGLWKAATREGFVLPVVVKRCLLPTLFDHLKRCELIDLSDDETRTTFRAFMTKQLPSAAPQTVAKPSAISNVPIRVPEHFLGREAALAEIETSLKRHNGRVAITALYGLRGVGKTTLAAAFAEQRRAAYRATWWLRAQTEATLRADLVGLGVGLGWVAADEKEQPALDAVMERLRHDGEGLLLVYDNAIDAESLRPHLPRGGAAQVLVTSNAQAWGALAHKVEIRLWPPEIGAEYLVARTGRAAERAQAEALSAALGGLPLAHEQAAAYCERLSVSLAAYHRRFEASPARLLDDIKHAPAEYHDGLTVAKTFALAIDAAAERHPAAEPLIVHAALLAPEPIPLLLFAEGREAFGEPLASALAGDGLDEALAALSAFALVDREAIPDERDPVLLTECLRLHRLVRQVAVARCDEAARAAKLGALIAAMRAVYPAGVFNDPATWPLARRLDAPALGLIESSQGMALMDGEEAATLLDRLASYRYGALAAYATARPLLKRALAIRETVLGPEHPTTATSLNNLAVLLDSQGELAAARPLYERALAIRETVLGPEHPDTATSLNNLGYLLQAQGDPVAARPLYERALAIRETVLGPEHPETAMSLNNLGYLLRTQGDPAAARPLYERALAICEKVLGPEHPETAMSLNNLGALLQAQGDLAAARLLFERALAIREKVLGPEHPATALSLNNLGALLESQGEPAAARPLFERALAIRETVLGPEHPDTKASVAWLSLITAESSGADGGATPPGPLASSEAARPSSGLRAAAVRLWARLTGQARA